MSVFLFSNFSRSPSKAQTVLNVWYMSQQAAQGLAHTVLISRCLSRGTLGPALPLGGLPTPLHSEANRLWEEVCFGRVLGLRGLAAGPQVCVELIQELAKEAAGRGMLTPTAPSSHGLVPGLVSSFCCWFPFPSHHPVDRQSHSGAWGAQHCLQLRLVTLRSLVPSW